MVEFKHGVMIADGANFLLSGALETSRRNSDRPVSRRLESLSENRHETMLVLFSAE